MDIPEVVINHRTAAGFHLQTKMNPGHVGGGRGREAGRREPFPFEGG
jgi:hypothetical protein